MNLKKQKIPLQSQAGKPVSQPTDQMIYETSEWFGAERTSNIIYSNPIMS